MKTCDKCGKAIGLMPHLLCYDPDLLKKMQSRYAGKIFFLDHRCNRCGLMVNGPAKLYSCSVCNAILCEHQIEDYGGTPFHWRYNLVDGKMVELSCVGELKEVVMTEIENALNGLLKMKATK